MQKIIKAKSIMLKYASSTGISGISHRPRRYLWTDAFAVCNYLGLYRHDGEEYFLQLALKLVDKVHQTLGKHRLDSGKRGWLSGLSDEQGLEHPTLGGLRIGKKMNERQPGEKTNESLEWDQDGQYFHYLTKWMHALNLVGHVTGKSIYHVWALELAKVAYSGFSYSPSSLSDTEQEKRLFWKMSIDLTRPLVDSMGHHDPLDGLITYLQLEATLAEFPEITADLSLKKEIKELEGMCIGKKWMTKDALGMGSLVSDTFKIVQLIDKNHIQEGTRLEFLLRDIELSFQAFMTYNQLHLPAQYRLAFRELGLAIGLHAIEKIQKTIEGHPDKFNNAAHLISTVNKLSSFHKISGLIEKFWLAPEHQLVSSWLEHADINNVMLATSLVPDGYLTID